MTDRKPLKQLSPEERKRRLEEMGLQHAPGDPLRDMLPFDLTYPERLAAQDPGLPARPKESSMGTPLVSGKLAAVAGVLATIFAAAASWAPSLTFLPSWAPFALWALASIAALLVGTALPEYKGGPVVAVTAVPALLAVSAGLKTVASQLPPGAVQSVVLFLSILVDALAGKALPVKEKEDVKA